MPQAHLARAFDNKVNLLLLLIVPWHLTAVRIQRHISQAEVLRLYGRCASDDVLCAAFCRISAALYVCEIRYDHEPKKVR